MGAAGCVAPSCNPALINHPHASPPRPVPPAPGDLVHRQLTRVSTLHRLFRPSMNRGLNRQEAEAVLEAPARRSFKERVRLRVGLA